jgi:hypothetical protein
VAEIVALTSAVAAGATLGGGFGVVEEGVGEGAWAEVVDVVRLDAAEVKALAVVMAVALVAPAAGCGGATLKYTILLAPPSQVPMTLPPVGTGALAGSASME